MIKKTTGGKFILKTHDGRRNLSKPTTKGKALKQERAIQAAKHARRGGR